MSATGNAIARYLQVAHGLHSLEVTHFRLLISTTLLIPWALQAHLRGRHAVCLRPHLLRGTLLFISTALWHYGLNKVPLALATIVEFSIPVITLISSYFLLRERVPFTLWLTTAGIFSSLSATSLYYQPDTTTISKELAILLLSAMLYALIDTLHKQQVRALPAYHTLFYVTLTATCWAIWPAYTHASTEQQLLNAMWLLVASGLANSLLLYCLLKAYSHTHLSELAPIRYLQLPIAISLGYAINDPTPIGSTWIASGTIILCTLVLYYRHRNKTRSSSKFASNDTYGC